MTRLRALGWLAIPYRQPALAPPADTPGAVAMDLGQSIRGTLWAPTGCTIEAVSVQGNVVTITYAPPRSRWH